MVNKLEARNIIYSTVCRLKQYLSQEPTPRLSEADTKANFIEKYIAALGYEGFEDIIREYYVKNSQEFIDYVLKCNGKLALAIEAKPLQSDLTDKHAAQLVQYCAVEGIEWCALSNGRELRLFNQYVKGDLQSKLVLKLDLLAFNSEDEYSAVFEQLWLLSKDSLSAPSGIKTWLEQRRMDRAIRSLVLNPVSPLIKALRKELASSSDLAVSSDAIVQWFRSQLSSNVVSIPSDFAVRSPSPDLATEPKEIGLVPQYWLFPAARGKDGCSSVEVLHRWLDKRMWGTRISPALRGKLRPGDRASFYATSVGVVATAAIAAAVNAKISSSEWPEPCSPDEDACKIPLSHVTWLADPIAIDDKLRSQLDAFKGKKPDGIWSWFVQRSVVSLTSHDFEVLTKQALLGSAS